MKLNVIESGSGVPIVWIHGFPLSSAMFTGQLSIPRARHIAADLPGFGRSAPPAARVTMDSYARSVIDLLDERGIASAVFAGVSMGGYVCFAAARIAPERIRGLILIDTRELPDTPEGRKGRYESIEKVKQRGVGVVVDSMLPKMLTASAPRSLFDEVRKIMESSSPEGVTAALRAMAERGDSSNLLPSLEVPALVVVGEDDTITPPADAQRMSRALPNARLVTIPGAAHLSNVEKPVEFNAAVADFLRALT